MADQDEGLLVGNMHTCNVIPSRQSIKRLEPGSLFPPAAGIWIGNSMKLTVKIHLLVQSPAIIPFPPNADQHTLDPLSNWD